MAFTVIAEPDMEKANPDEWRLMAQDLQVFSLGLLSITVEGMDSDAAPRVLGVIEVNGRKFMRNIFDSVSGSPQAINAVNYIYARPDGNQMTLYYASVSPDWTAAKGGWYQGNDRAIAKFFYTGGQYNGKVILDSYNAMQMMNTKQTIPGSGGEKVADGAQAMSGVTLIDGSYISQGTNTVVSGSNSSGKVYQVTLPRGAYRYEIAAGKGGKGGNSAAGAGDGGNGAGGQAKSGTFLFIDDKPVYYALGGDGVDGANATNNAGGGGGCTGGSAFIDIAESEKFILCAGGSGGGGSSGETGGGFAGGGGGGGGYGQGGQGSEVGPNRAGKGGNNFNGGNGGSAGTGYWYGGGGGGGSGSSGGSGGEGRPVGAFGANGSGGGGYGGSGGNGGRGLEDDESTTTSGGSGGSSMNGENDNLMTCKYPHRVQWQGGGGGGGYSVNGANGSGGLKSASSGYLRIYRMW